MEYLYNVSSFQISLTLTTAQLEGNEWRKEWIPFSAFSVYTGREQIPTMRWDITP